MAAAVWAFVVLPVKKSVCSVTGWDFWTLDWPYPCFG